MCARPGGRLLPGEGDVEGLKRKLTNKLWERVHGCLIYPHGGSLRACHAIQLPVHPPAHSASTDRTRARACILASCGSDLRAQPYAPITCSAARSCAREALALPPPSDTPLHRTQPPAKSSAAHKGQMPEWVVGEMLATWWRPTFESAALGSRLPRLPSSTGPLGLARSSVVVSLLHRCTAGRLAGHIVAWDSDGPGVVLVSANQRSARRCNIRTSQCT